MTLLLLMLACGTSPSDEPIQVATDGESAKQAEPEPTLAEAWAALTDEASRHTWLMTQGEAVYLGGGQGGIACRTCHKEDGKGIRGAYPPLVGQREHMGDCRQSATIVIEGLMGPMEVDGITYNGVMTPQGELLDDYEIAAVLTYVRNSWGNDYGDCSPSAVAAARKKDGP